MMQDMQVIHDASTARTVCAGDRYIGISCGESNSVYIYENKDGSRYEPVSVIKEKSGINMMGFGPDRKVCLVASQNGVVKIGRIETSHHGKYREERDCSKSLRDCLQDKDNLELINFVQFQNEICSFATLLGICCGNEFVVLNLANDDSDIGYSLVDHENKDESLVAGGFLTVGNRHHAVLIRDDSVVSFWELGNRREKVFEMDKHESVQCFAVAQDFQQARIAFGTRDGFVHVYNVTWNKQHFDVTLDHSINLALQQNEMENDNFLTVIDVYFVEEYLIVTFPSRIVFYDLVGQTIVHECRFEEYTMTNFAVQLREQGVGSCIMSSCFSRAVRVLPFSFRQNSSTRKRLEDGPEIDDEDDEEEDIEIRERDEKTEYDDDELGTIYSVFPTRDPEENSPLKTKPLTKKQQHQGKKKNVSLNKPVTFHSKIRSSGYGSMPPPNRLFQGSKSKIKGSRGVGTALSTRTNVPTTYPVDSDVMNTLSEEQAEPYHNGAINQVRYSYDGTFIGTCSTDKSARVGRQPFSKPQATVDLTDHQECVNSIDFSYSSNLLKLSGGQQQTPLMLTSSNDGTAKLWSTSVSHPLATFTSLSKGNNEQVKRKSQPRPMTEALFYYMDHFVLTSSGSELCLHQFRLDEATIQPSKDLKAQQQKHKVQNANHNTFGSPNQRIVARWDCKQDAHAITSFAAMNSFLSNIILTARSNRTIAVVDAAANRCSRLITSERMEDRVAHTIRFPTSSTHASHPASAFDMFITSSTAYGGCISLWDLRARECVSRFTGHQNRVQTIGASISPCMRYVATGSEDNSCYLYDIRMGGEILDRLFDRQRDTVSDVIFHPLKPQLITASHDGKLRLYTATKL